MLYFYYGADTYSLTAAAKELKAQYPLVEELDFVRPESDSGGGRREARLREVLQSQGLFARKKLVVLRGWTGEIGDIGEIGEIRDSDILFLETEMPDRRLKFFKWLVKNAESREFTAPAGAALEKWIREFAQNKIENDAVKELIARIGEPQDLRQYASELEKLMLSTPPAPPILGGENTKSSSPKIGEEGRGITVEAVQSLVPRNFHDDIFAVTNAFAEGRTGEAVGVLERLPIEPVQIIGGLAAQIRSLLLVKALAGKSPAEMAATLGWKEGRVWINQRLAGKFTIDKLRTMLRDLLAIDRRLKTTEEPPKLLLQLFLQKAKT